MALATKFLAVHRLVSYEITEKKGVKTREKIVVDPGSEYAPADAAERDRLLKSGAIRPIRKETKAEAVEGAAAAEAAKAATGNAKP